MAVCNHCKPSVPPHARARCSPSSPFSGGGKRRRAGRPSIILQKPLDVIKLFLRAGKVAEPPAQFVDDAARALHVDLARDLHRRVVAVLVPAQWPAEWIGVLLGARLTEAAGTSEPGTAPHLLLHGLRQP